MSATTTSLVTASMAKLAEKDIMKTFVRTKIVKLSFVKRDTPEAAGSTVNLGDANSENSVDSNI